MPHPALELSAVVHRYADGTVALDGVDLTVPEGDSVALLGANGAGKSTLLLHLNGVLRPTSGGVRVEGVEVCDATVSDIRRRVGIVFQDPDDQLFMTTLYDDVAFGPLNMGMPREAVDVAVHEALHAVGLADEASRPAARLSLGQRKRAAVATVTAMSPSILVMDEPTSNLDPRARARMITLLRGCGRTKVLATHDLDLASRLCSRAVVMDGGRIVADLPVERLVADGDLLRSHGLAADDA